MTPNTRMALSALKSGLCAKNYLIEFCGYTSNSKELTSNANTLASLMEQARNGVRERTKADAIEHDWAKKAVSSHLEAEPFLRSCMVINPATQAWQIAIMTDVLGKMIEAEQARRRSSTARESDVMETGAAA